MEHEEFESFSIAVNAVSDAAPDDDLLAQWRSRAATLAEVPAPEAEGSSIGDELFGRLRLVADDLSRAARKARKLLPSIEREQPIAVADETVVEVELAPEPTTVAEPATLPRQATLPIESASQVASEVANQLASQVGNQVAKQVATDVVSEVSTQLSQATAQLTSTVTSQLAAELSGLRDVMLTEMSGLAELRQQMLAAPADEQIALTRSSAMLALIAAAEDVMASFPKRRSARTVQRLANLEEQLRTMAALVGLEGVTIKGSSATESRVDTGQRADAVAAEGEAVAIC